MLLSWSTLLSLLLALLPLSSFSLCYCRRRHYHRFYSCYYPSRPSLYVFVTVVIIIAFTSVIIVIVFLFILLSSSLLSSPLLALLFLSFILFM